MSDGKGKAETDESMKERKEMLYRDHAIVAPTREWFYVGRETDDGLLLFASPAVINQRPGLIPHQFFFLEEAVEQLVQIERVYGDPDWDVYSAKFEKISLPSKG